MESRTLLTTVTSLLDTIDSGDGQTTLREAILEANAAPGADVINFALSGTITLTSQLPVIKETVEIDGSTQSILIDATGVTAASNAHVLKIDGSNPEGLIADGSYVHDISFVNTAFAISTTDASRLTFTDINADGVGPTRTGDTLVITGGDNHTIRRVSASNRSKGIVLVDVTDSTIEFNIAHNSSVNDQRDSGRNVFSENDFSDSHIALSLSGNIGGSTAIDNNLSNSDVALDVMNGIGNKVFNNDLSNSSLSGLRIWNDNQITIDNDNDFTGSRNGIELFDFEQTVIQPTGYTVPEPNPDPDPLVPTPDPYATLPVIALDHSVSGVTRIAVTLHNPIDVHLRGLDLTETGGAALAVGLAVTRGDDVTIEDIEVNNRLRGVDFNHTTNSRVTGSNLASAWSGIRSIGTSTNNEFVNNTVTAGTGISLVSTVGGDLAEDNDASGSALGIQVSNGMGNRLIDNNLSHAGTASIRILHDDAAVIAGNDFTGSRGGIEFWNFEDVVIQPPDYVPPNQDPFAGRAIITMDADFGAVTHTAIVLRTVTDVAVRGIDATSAGVRQGTGILTTSSTGVTLVDITAQNRAYGVQNLATVASEIVDSQLQNNGVGIFDNVASGRNDYITNDVSGSGTGLRLHGADGPHTVDGNTIVGTVNGIEIRNGSGNNITNNDLSQSALVGNSAAIVVWDDTELKLSGNDFTGSKNGIALYDFEDVLISPSVDSPPILEAGQTWVMADVDLSQVTGSGLYLLNATQVSVEGLDLGYSGVTASGIGLHFNSGEDNTVHGVTIENRSTGILLQSEVSATVSCSELLNNVTGLHVTGSSNGIVATLNHLAGNQSAMNNVTANAVDGTFNYWGAANGSSTDGGNGDPYTGNVDASNPQQVIPECARTNLPPELGVESASVSANEGDVPTNAGTWSDAVDDVVTLTASVGQVVQEVDGTWTWSLDTNDGPDDSRSVMITATDQDEESTQVTFALTVNNVAPSVDNAGNVTVNEGATAANTGSYSDPGADTISLSASAGAVVDNGNGTYSWSFDTNDGPDQSQTVTITATDSDGAATDSTFDLTVNNVAPSVDNAGNVTVNEGATAANSGRYSDPGADTVSLTASIGTVLDNGNGTYSWSFDTNDGPDQSQTVTITATDSDGAATNTTFGLTVNNVSPVIESVASSNPTIDTASTDGVVTVGGSFSDPGLDTHTVTVNWGDGTVEDVSVDQAADTFNGSHDYAGGGIYVVTITSIDSDSAVSSSVTTNAVVVGTGVVDGTLYVIGTDGRDVIHVHRHWRRDEIKVHARLNIGSQYRQHIRETFDASDVENIFIHARGHNDHAHVGGFCFDNIDVDAVIYGGDGRDHLIGSRGNDYIDGGEGDDFIFGHSGNDTIVDMAGNNYVSAGYGDDVVTTGAGNDHISGSRGNDRINAGDGRNNVSGGFGNDIIIAGGGDDRLYGNHGDDVVSGGGGNDRIYGGHGDDVLIGGTGRDRISGDHGDDIVIGGSVVNDSDEGSLEAALSAWTNSDLADALLSLGTIVDDAERDDLRGGRGDDEIFSGSGDRVRG